VPFRFWRLRLWFQALAPIQFPPTLAANVFRGALGTRLPRPLFAPVRHQKSPSGLGDPPRPFVLRARHLDGVRFLTNQRFSLDLHLFARFASEIREAFEHAPPFHGAVQLAQSLEEEVVDMSLAPSEQPMQSARILFLTPTELKHNAGLTTTPEFPILFARALARVRNLASLYGKPLDSDFAGLQLQAEQIRITGQMLTHEFAERFSTRTGQTHPLGGFLGHADYQGDLRELVPVLEAAQYTGVGRQTVWGKGEIRVEAGHSPANDAGRCGAAAAHVKLAFRA